MRVGRSEVRLVIGDTSRYVTRWSRYNLAASMFDAGNPFTFSLHFSETDLVSFGEIVSQMRHGERVLVTIDGAPCYSGTIEDLNDEDDADDGIVYTISGRDMAASAVTWHVDPRISISKETLEATIERLFRNLSLDVVVSADPDVLREIHTNKRAGGRGHLSKRARHQLVDHKTQHGETVWSSAVSATKQLGYMIWPDASQLGQLALVIDKPDYDSPPVFVFERRVRADGRIDADASNIIKTSSHSSIRDIPTIAWAWARNAPGDRLPSRIRTNTNYGRDVDVGRMVLDSLHFRWDAKLQRLVSTLAPPSPHRPRPTHRVPYANTFANDPEAQRLLADLLPKQPVYLNTKKARDPQTARQEVQRVFAEAMAKFRHRQVIVQGHYQVINNLKRTYAFNTMSTYIDETRGIQEDMLITNVEFIGDSGSQLTRVTLGPKNAIVLTPSST